MRKDSLSLRRKTTITASRGLFTSLSLLAFRELRIIPNIKSEAAESSFPVRVHNQIDLLKSSSAICKKSLPIIREKKLL
jgi:hypothetical protein